MHLFISDIPAADFGFKQLEAYYKNIRTNCTIKKKAFIY